MADPDRRVFEYFRASADTEEEVDYLAYASYAYSKFEWFDKYVERNGREPAVAEIEKWIGELPDSRLDEFHSTAARVFRNAARAYMQESIKAEQAKAVANSIDAEIKRHNSALEALVISKTSFSNQLVPNVVVSILSSVILAVILILASLIFVKDPSPLALYKSLAPSGRAPAQPPSPALSGPEKP